MTSETGKSAARDDRNSVAVKRPHPHVAVVTIASQPLGVLRTAVRQQLGDILRGLEQDKTVRAVVLTGSGGAFSVGSDVREFEHSAEWLRAFEAAETALNDQIEESRLPVIAALNGATLGGGLVLALACDMRIAAHGISLGVPEVKVGTFASAGGTWRLPVLIGPGRALRLLLTGGLIDAGEAARIGLVDEVAEDAIATALDLAIEIASMPTMAVEATKSCVIAGLRGGEAAGRAAEERHVVPVGLSPDAIEGRRAFIEKRPPEFS